MESVEERVRKKIYRAVEEAYLADWSPERMAKEVRWAWNEEAEYEVERRRERAEKAFTP